MKKRILIFPLMCFMMLLLSVTAFATASGECGVSSNNVTWELDANGLLKISGTGSMKDFSSYYTSASAPPLSTPFRGLPH